MPGWLARRAAGLRDCLSANGLVLRGRSQSVNRPRKCSAGYSPLALCLSVGRSLSLWTTRGCTPGHRASLAARCFAHQSSDMLYRPVLAQEASTGASATKAIVVTFMQPMMFGPVGSECRTPPILVDRSWRSSVILRRSGGLVGGGSTSLFMSHSGTRHNSPNACGARCRRTNNDVPSKMLTASGAGSRCRRWGALRLRSGTHAAECLFYPCHVRTFSGPLIKREVLVNAD